MTKDTMEKKDVKKEEKKDKKDKPKSIVLEVQNVRHTISQTFK